MDLVKAMQMAAMGMKAQGTRMRVISENLANSQTTPASKDEEPYRRQFVTFKNLMDRETGVRSVKAGKVLEDMSSFGLRYDPQHPAANESGYVLTPNVNPLVEIMDMREAQRSYEANLGVIELTRTMLGRTIELLRA